MDATIGGPEPLAGEDIHTVRWEDCRHWIGIYADLLRFKVSVPERVRTELAKLVPEPQRAAQVDLVIIEDQMKGYEERLDMWYRRLWELQGCGSIPTATSCATARMRSR